MNDLHATVPADAFAAPAEYVQAGIVKLLEDALVAAKAGAVVSCALVLVRRGASLGAGNCLGDYAYVADTTDAPHLVCGLETLVDVLE